MSNTTQIMHADPTQVGAYRLLERIGVGGMGAVYRARDEQLQRDVAVKLLIGDWDSKPELLQRFLREAQFLASINHPNVVQVYQVGEHQGKPYFAMELLEQSLHDVQRLRNVSIEQATRWIYQAATGLAAIHDRGLVHRDIKPGNLLLTAATNTADERVKVADLGIAFNDSQSRLTQVGMLLGTSGYMAPEMIIGERYDHRADQYALGVAYYELLTRQKPRNFTTNELLQGTAQLSYCPDPRQLNSQIDLATAHLVQKMLHIDPNQRFASDQALLHAFVQALNRSADQAIKVLPPTIPAASSFAPGPVPVPAIFVTPSAPALPPVLASRTPRSTSLPVILAAVFGTALLMCIGFVWWALAQAPSDPAEIARAEVPGEASSSDGERGEKLVFDPEELLYDYELKAKGSKSEWRFEIYRHQKGKLQARLRGPSPQAIELKGRIESQSSALHKGQTWFSVAMFFEDDQARQVKLDLDYSEDTVDGNGNWIEGEHVTRFTVESADPLPE